MVYMVFNNIKVGDIRQNIFYINNRIQCFPAEHCLSHYIHQIFKNLYIFTINLDLFITIIIIIIIINKIKSIFRHSKKLSCVPFLKVLQENEFVNVLLKILSYVLMFFLFMKQLFFFTFQNHIAYIEYCLLHLIDNLSYIYKLCLLVIKCKCIK